MHPSLLIAVTDKSQAGDARRQARVWAGEAGCDEGHVERVALVVTELAKNLDLHTTKGGCLILRRVGGERAHGVEILALDAGPGTANFGQFMRDGFSTAGTPGTGLGAVQRASRVFEVYSQPGAGTALLSQVWPSQPAGGGDDAPRWLVGAVNLPVRGETVTGDGWCFQEGDGGRARVIVADGLGHGPAAAEAARAALATFDQGRETPLPALMETIHEALRSTRGAALAMAEIDPAQEKLRYVGVGNIAASVFTHAGSHSLVSANGTVGMRCEKIQLFSYAWPRGATLVINSDGLKTQRSIVPYAGLLGRHPGLIAGVMYRDHNRGTDDTTVAVVRAAA